MTHAFLRRSAALSLLVLAGATLAISGCSSSGPRSAATSAPAATVRRPNVLFIAVDDLRPMLGSYGVPVVQSPHIDRLAARGVLFERAYCQDSVCNPSRSSMLTGRRPDTTQVFDNGADFRTYLPDIATMPEQFRRHGYRTLAIGKILHSQWEHAYVGNTMADNARSWSEPNWFPPTVQFYFTPEGRREAREVFARTPGCPLHQGGHCLHTLRAAGALPASAVDPADPKYDEWTQHFVMGPITEAPDVPDETLYDGQVANQAIATLQRVKDEPFFLAVGFSRPHIPLVAPKRYWDLYQRQQFKVPSNSTPPSGSLPWSLSEGQANGAYSDMPANGVVGEADALRIIHGYHACVSYVDAQVGKVLAELDRLGLTEDTIVVFWGDHGYYLGEHGRWGKSSLAELANRIPLIIAAPGRNGNGRKSPALVEAVDLFPTLCELAGTPLSPGLEGTSMVPLLDHPARSWKTAAFSQYPRPVRVAAAGPVTAPDDKMGYSMRTDRYRYMEWRYVTRPGEIAGRELYDHQADPQENRNIAGDPANAALILELHARMEAGWQAARPPRP